MARVWVAPRAETRLAMTVAWLAARAADEPTVLVGATIEGAARAARAGMRDRDAVFGWQRWTLDLLARQLALPALARRGAAPLAGVALAAVCARVVDRLATAGALGRFARVADKPGLARALARTFDELGAAGVGPADLKDAAADLARLYGAYGEELDGLGLVDRAGVLAAACEQVAVAGAGHPQVGLPVAFVDPPVASRAEAALVAALAAAASDAVITLPSGDARARALLEEAMGVEAAEAPKPAYGADDALGRVQRHLFGAEERGGVAGEDVVVFSAPGESRECIEIARRIHREAEAGLAFDRMAVILRAPEMYRVHLALALGRAEIPAHFTRGTVRPDPSGRALLALLDCAAERLSARAFAEYLSLAVVPKPDEHGAPPAAPPPGERFVPPESLGPDMVERVGEGEGDGERASEEDAEGDRRALRVPRRWERLLVDAAVIGGSDRWRRRLDGLASAFAAELDAFEDPDDPRRARVARRARDLEALRAFALPLLDDLAALPEVASWAEWTDVLSALATRAVRRPERVLAVLAELEPMAPVGGVTLAEVRLVLGRRLSELVEAPSGSASGKVYVASVDEARGMSFDLVFVPGLAEKIFPHKVVEDPVLLDAERARIDAPLATNSERVAAERAALRVAVGAAARRVVLSYPRLDTEKARPRVPSFYGLEVLRAAEGVLPGFRELARRADAVGAARMRWPAPVDPGVAIDAAEYDLAVLERLLGAGRASRGAARYLLSANEHLARALRFRALRWTRKAWTPADGLVGPGPAALAALARHHAGARAFSPTALQHFAACPYRFYLHTVIRLSPRDTAESIEELDALQRGSLIHDVQFETLGRLRAADLLPVTAANHDRARAHLDAALADVAARYRDDLAPAIDRVWDDGIAAIGRDLREWLHRSVDAGGWVPAHFELAFGLPRSRERDPASVPDPVALDCGLTVRGAIDLVEDKDGRLRATDHKTGRAVADRGLVVGGGEILQPVLYAMALEKLFPDAPVEAGRLYYCTDRGGYAEAVVPLDERAREAVGEIAAMVSRAVETGFLPAAPREDACRWCDYVPVCGPYEEMRTRTKDRRPLGRLIALRRKP